MSKRKLIIKIKLSSKRIYKLDLTYFLENWGAPFIITFMILLITAAAYLALGNELTANKLAEYAYYNLVAGVLLQLAYFIREERKRKHEKPRRS
ncbi:MAG: hypothetical protein NDF55_03670 [archaeon GB-1867-005]|nr:hypothetical protein [Candidatus Culexmicrobium cathedralense]